MNRPTRKEAKRGNRILFLKRIDPIIGNCPCSGKPCRVRLPFMPCIKSIGCMAERNLKK